MMDIQQVLKKVMIRVNNQAVLLGLCNQRSKPGHYLLDKVHNTLEDLQVKQVRDRGLAVQGYKIWRGRMRLEDGS